MIDQKGPDFGESSGSDKNKNNNNIVILSKKKNNLLASTISSSLPSSSSSVSSPSSSVSSPSSSLPSSSSSLPSPSSFDNVDRSKIKKDLRIGQLENQGEGKTSSETLGEAYGGGGRDGKRVEERKVESIVDGREIQGEGEIVGEADILEDAVRGEREGEVESVGEGNLISYIRMTAFDRIGSKVLVDILDDQVTFVRASKFLLKIAKVHFCSKFFLRIRDSNFSV